MKNTIWLEGWINLKSAEMNLEIKTYGNKEDKKFFYKIIKELRKGWRKCFRNVLKMEDIEKLSRDNTESKSSVPKLRKHRIYYKQSPNPNKEQKGGYNE